MAIPLDSKQVVSFEELLMSQVVQQEALTRLLMEEGVFSKEEFLERVGVVNGEMKGKRRENASGVTNGWKSSFYMERGQR
jgi:hypothetical protein